MTAQRELGRHDHNVDAVLDQRWSAEQLRRVRQWVSESEALQEHRLC